MAKEKIVKGIVSDKKNITEKVEIKSSTPVGFVHCVVLKDYEDKKEGDELILVERRYKSLALRGFVK